MIRIVLVEDHQIVRQGLHALLNRQPGIEVIGEAANGAEALTLAETLRPDVMLLDLRMPEMSGLDLLDQLSQLHYHPRVLVLSMHTDAAYIYNALHKGALGYVLKGDGADLLISAVRAVSEGRRFVAPGCLDSDPDDFVKAPPDVPLDRFEMLTNRELELLPLITEGLTSIQIAQKIAISPRTVDVHRTSIMRKLGVSSITELVLYMMGRQQQDR